MTQSIGVVALKHSNYRSVEKAFLFLGHKAKLLTNNSDFTDITHLVLPGVSSFGSVVSELHEMQIYELIKSLYGSRIKILGLCAGMQIMGHSSAESPSTLGFSWFDWKCSPLINTEGRRVFHTGWNMVASSGGEGFCKELVNEDFYFNHSFFIPKSEVVSHNYSYSRFGVNEILSFIESKNVWGIQFHPEKSQQSGLRVLSSFAKWHLL